MEKKDYVSPTLELTLLEMEQGIAAGSAKVTPGDSQQQVKENWDTGQDENLNLEW